MLTFLLIVKKILTNIAKMSMLSVMFQVLWVDKEPTIFTNATFCMGDFFQPTYFRYSGIRQWLFSLFDCFHIESLPLKFGNIFSFFFYPIVTTYKRSAPTLGKYISSENIIPQKSEIVLLCPAHYILW